MSTCSYLAIVTFINFSFHYYPIKHAIISEMEVPDEIFITNKAQTTIKCTVSDLTQAGTFSWYQSDGTELVETQTDIVIKNSDVDKDGVQVSEIEVSRTKMQNILNGADDDTLKCSFTSSKFPSSTPGSDEVTLKQLKLGMLPLYPRQRNIVKQMGRENERERKKKREESRETEIVREKKKRRICALMMVFFQLSMIHHKLATVT